MAEANPENGTITDDAYYVDMLSGEQGANPEEDDQAAPDAEEEAELPEGGEETQDEPETAEEEQPVEPAKFTVKIDGKDVEVSQDELLNGYQRQADYSRKTAEVAREREIISGAAKQLQSQLQFWMIPKNVEPDWADMAQKMEPREFNQRRAEWDQAQVRSNQARALHNQIAQQEHSQLLEREQAALVSKLPEWSSAEVARKDLSAITATAAEFGFSEAEIGAVTDHRVILMARELAQLKAAKSALTTQKQVTPPKVVTPQGRAATKDAGIAEQNKKLVANLKRSGSDADALALLMGR